MAQAMPCTYRKMQHIVLPDGEGERVIGSASEKDVFFVRAAVE